MCFGESHMLLRCQFVDGMLKSTANAVTYVSTALTHAGVGLYNFVIGVNGMSLFVVLILFRNDCGFLLCAINAFVQESTLLLF